MVADQSPTPSRRPLKTRSHRWAQVLASGLVKMRASPNAISVAGIGIALLGGTILWSTGRGWLPNGLVLFLGATCVQFRLLCNMLDGLVAVEGGLKSKAGDLFNELPDRLEDLFLLVGAGYASESVELGWLCTALALLTAYVRALGGSLGQPQDFCGPGAKPHRMFFLTVGCLAGIFHPLALRWSLWLIAFVTLVTVIRRTVRLYRRLP
jgi:phosphatidylglycerophosphate synthase